MLWLGISWIDTAALSPGYLVAVLAPNDVMGRDLVEWEEELGCGDDITLLYAAAALNVLVSPPLDGMIRPVVAATSDWSIVLTASHRFCITPRIQREHVAG